MAEGEFQVVFRGEITGDQPVEVVKQQLGNLFRMPPERVEALFSGKPVVVKKNIDESTARKLEQAFLRAGAACEVRGSSSASAPATPDASAATTAPAEPAAERSATRPEPTPSGRNAGSIAAAGDPNHTVVHLAVPDSFEGLEIDTSDAPLTASDGKPAPEIDTSGLSLAAADAGPLSERKTPPPAEIDTSGLSMESLDEER
ncbi:hypothetical protein [Halofilum ochraceum]|uniref:hypothetical protein n=1 Tax=Halofilum ochraceum TaxID=1611323 RepID=UPI0008DA23CF|nr:hypothetical protein [Halofilum ochraceum]